MLKKYQIPLYFKKMNKISKIAGMIAIMIITCTISIVAQNRPQSISEIYKSRNKTTKYEKTVASEMKTYRSESATGDTIFIDSTLYVKKIIPTRLTHEIYVAGTFTTRTEKFGVEAGYGQLWRFKNSERFGYLWSAGASYQVGALYALPDENGYEEELQFNQLGINGRIGLYYSTNRFSARITAGGGWDHVEDTRFMRSDCVYSTGWCISAKFEIGIEGKIANLGKGASLWLGAKGSLDLSQYETKQKGKSLDGSVDQKWNPGSTNTFMPKVNLAVRF